MHFYGSKYKGVHSSSAIGFGLQTIQIRKHDGSDYFSSAMHMFVPVFRGFFYKHTFVFLVKYGMKERNQRPE